MRWRRFVRPLPTDFVRERLCEGSDTLDDTIMADLQQLVDQDPNRSTRSMARELGLSDLTVRKKMSQDIYHKSYTFKRGQFMNAATKKKRFAKAKLLLNRLKALMRKFFSRSEN
jgi:hypothetical protein